MLAQRQIDVLYLRSLGYKSILKYSFPEYYYIDHHPPASMRIARYKLILLVSSIIIVFYNIGTLHQLSYSERKSTVTPRVETTEYTDAERTLSRGVIVQISPLSYNVNNYTQSEGNNKNKSEMKIEMSSNNTLYYSALPGTRNSWTLFDIRRGATKKRLEVIGLRLIIVDTIPGDFYLIILFFANTE